MKKNATILLAVMLTLLFPTGNVFGADYTVKSGDTLWEISKNYNVPIKDLVELNGIQNQNLIMPGQILKIKQADVDKINTNTLVENKTTTELKPMPELIPVKKDIDPDAGADSADPAANHIASKYYVNPDFYQLKSDSNLTILHHFKTYQQTSEWSCGSATILMVLEHFGIHQYGEWDIALKSGAHIDLDTANAQPGSANNYPEYGTSIDDIVKFFKNTEGFKIVETSFRDKYEQSDLIPVGDKSVPETEWGNLPPTFNSVSLYASDNNTNTENWVTDAKDSYFVKWITGHLNANRPILVEWGDWDGHWQAIIGYDTNGTPAIRDDVIIFADPYDTTDGWQDGYYYYPAERWFYMWQDRAVAPKPYQLQPYIVVEPVK